MKIKAVLYDMDGTLLDTEKLHKRAWTVTAAKRGVTMGPEFYQGAMGRNLTRVFALIEELYPNIGDIRSLYEEKEALCRKWMEEGGVPVLPGVYHTLGLLKALGVKQCVCTSTSRDSAEKTLTSAGILPKLNALMCGDDLEKSKPDPQIFLRGAQKLNTPIEECAVVEDAPAGVEAGLRSGARVFIVPGMLEMPQEFEARCTRINSLWELPTRLEEA